METSESFFYEGKLLFRMTLCMMAVESSTSWTWMIMENLKRHPGGGGSRIGSIPLWTANYITTHYVPIASTLCFQYSTRYIITHSRTNCANVVLQSMLPTTTSPLFCITSSYSQIGCYLWLLSKMTKETQVKDCTLSQIQEDNSNCSLWNIKGLLMHCRNQITWNIRSRYACATLHLSL